MSATNAFTRPDQSHIDVRAGGISFVGKDAVNLYRAMALLQALQLYVRCKMLVTRTATAASLLELAAAYTGKTYKRGQHAQAADDVRIWVETMKAAMPITQAPEATQ